MYGVVRHGRVVWVVGVECHAIECGMCICTAIGCLMVCGCRVLNWVVCDVVCRLHAVVWYCIVWHGLVVYMHMCYAGGCFHCRMWCCTACGLYIVVCVVVCFVCVRVVCCYTYSCAVRWYVLLCSVG